MPSDRRAADRETAQSLRALKENDPMFARRRLEVVVRDFPDHFQAWNTLGEACVAQELWDSAEDAFWQAARLVPDTWPCWFNLLVCACRRSAPAETVARLARMVLGVLDSRLDAAADERSAAMGRVAWLLLDSGQPALGEDAAVRWHAVGGGDEALAVRARCQHQLGRWTDALPVWQDLTGRYAEDASHWAHLGLALGECERFEEAVAAYRRSLELRPDNPAVMNNLTHALQFCGVLDEQLSWMEKAIAHAPDNAGYYKTRGVLLLKAGRYREGYADYERRLDTYTRGDNYYDHALGMRDLGFPLWLGEPLAGKRLFVHPEQGHGDFLMAVRLLPLVRRRSGAAQVSFFSPRNLARYARALPLGEGVEYRHEIQLGETDFYTPILSLMHRLDLATEEDIPPPVAPEIDKETIGRWKERRAGIAGGRGRAVFVGITWRGSNQHPLDAWRTIAFGEFLSGAIRPLLRRQVCLVSLQKDMTEAERGMLASIGVETGWIDACEDWYETAALVGQLDAVLGVDTALIHLAGSLGMPAVMLDRIASLSDWRWLAGRADSPWYPSLRIVSQERRGQWDGAMRQGVAEVLRLLQGDAGANVPACGEIGCPEPEKQGCEA